MFFFFNDTASTAIYTLSLHDALPILGVPFSSVTVPVRMSVVEPTWPCRKPVRRRKRDRKSTRLNSSHTVISYAVFCLKKKKLENAEPARREVVKHLDSCLSCLSCRST